MRDYRQVSPLFTLQKKIVQKLQRRKGYIEIGIDRRESEEEIPGRQEEKVRIGEKDIYIEIWKDRWDRQS